MQLEHLLTIIKERDRNCRLRLKFSEPVPSIFTQFLRGEDVTEITVDHFFVNNITDAPMIYATNRSNARYGRRFTSNYIEKLLSVEPVHRMNQAIVTYEKFLKYFDLKYIAEEKVMSLWNDRGTRTWRKKDFKPMGSTAKRTFTEFNERFKGITDIASELSGAYCNNGYGNKELRRHHSGYGNRSRDITVSHQQGTGYVYYASEFRGCGNGSYGFVARKNVWLHIEDD
jgi:hypothetical protein